VQNDGVTQDSNRPAPRSLTGWVVGSVMGPIVRPVVDAVDVDDVVDRIDVNELISRVDLDALVARIDPQMLLDRIDVNELISRVEPDELIARIDMDAVLDRVDVNRVLARVEPDTVLDRVDVNRLLDRVAPDALLDRVDVNRLLDRVAPDALLDRVDVNRLLDQVEPDALLDRVDVNRLLDRVDPHRLLDRVDPNPLVERVDLDHMMARVDVNALVQRTELGEIIARSTTGVFGQLLDLARTAIMSVDLVVHGTLGRLARRDPWLQRRPDAPEVLTPIRGLPATERAVALQGHHAGSVSRFLAFLLDTTVAATLFTLLAGLAVLALDVVADVTWVADDHRLLMSIAFVLWQLVYFAAPTALTGRTVGKAVLGVRVVDRSGAPVGGWGALVRTLVFPVSFVLFGLGFLLALVRRDRRMLHDLVGRTAVVYAWDAEVARLRANADGTEGRAEPGGPTSLLHPQLPATSPEVSGLFARPGEPSRARPPS
jgi:uncharacterized RDD family membrane protein YckC